MDTSSGGLGSWCTSRICAGSAAEVAAHIEQRIVLDSRFATAVATLDLNRSGRSVASVGAPRSYAARLRFSRWRRPARVTLEIERWSTDRSELLIRPGRHAPYRSDAYLDAALALADAVGSEVDRTAAVVADPGAREPGLRRAS
jgi:hypothetical protein